MDSNYWRCGGGDWETLYLMVKQHHPVGMSAIAETRTKSQHMRYIILEGLSRAIKLLSVTAVTVQES